MQTITTLERLRPAVDELRAAGPVALVPTMGALHDGHLALIRAARQHAPFVVVSIFVNPRQFGPDEDLERYPRQLEADAQLLEAEGVAVLWAPQEGQMYPPGFATSISVCGVSEGLCGAARPGHFAGVATVVAKLFNQVRPDWAFFGEKDWQQLAVIRSMARDLDLVAPHVDRILAVPTVRESDGLALSSRNAYLSPQGRANAAALPRAMQTALRAIAAGAPVAACLEQVRESLLGSGFSAVDYVTLVDADTLAPLSADNGNARLMVAARIEGARLIDNMPLQARHDRG